MPQPRLLLSLAERRESHRILLRDAAALATLSALVLVLSFVTYFLFHSFEAHRLMLERRWRARGEAALAAGHAPAALAGLHSALAYAPGDRGLQVELAMALAAEGKTQEAQTYFNTLLESEPGNGLINLQLARLAVRENNPQSAVDHYEAAIDGTWNGDAYTQRRKLRLELALYLIAQKRLPEARDQLLVAAGNAPQDAHVQMEVGKLLIDAQDASDALDVFHRAAQDKGARLQALEAEGQTAMTLGRYQAAHTFLAHAMGDAAFGRQADAQKKSVRVALGMARTVLALYPADTLSPQERARRIEHDAELAQKRLAGCPAPAVPAPAPAPAASPKPAAPAAGAPLLNGLAAHLRALNPLAKSPAPSTPAPAPQPAAANPLSPLTARWAALPTGDELHKQLVANPDFADSVLELVYETMRSTSGCGPLDDEEQALAKIAANPGQVEAQP